MLLVFCQLHHMVAIEAGLRCMHTVVSNIHTHTTYMSPPPLGVCKHCCCLKTPHFLRGGTVVMQQTRCGERHTDGWGLVKVVCPESLGKGMCGGLERSVFAWCAQESLQEWHTHQQHTRLSQTGSRLQPAVAGGVCAAVHTGWALENVLVLLLLIQDLLCIWQYGGLGQRLSIGSGLYQG